MTERATSDDSRIFSFQDDAVADAYRRGAAVRAQRLGPANELMLDLAGVGPGSRVLDVAAGNGEQTVSLPAGSARLEASSRPTSPRGCSKLPPRPPARPA